MGRKLLCILLAVAGMALTTWFRPGTGKESAASFCPQAPVQEATLQELDRPQRVVFPCSLGNSGLVAEGMRAYDGLYLEDGSNDPVEGVAALMVYNAGSRDISSAMVTVEQNGKKLHFFLTWLPAGSRVLVLEYSRATYTSGQITGCSAAGVRWEAFYADGVTVEDGEYGQLLVTTKGGRLARNIRLRYKLYVMGEGYYLGGITYCTYVGILLSGESRDVAPQWYGVGHSRVVAILAD